MVTWTSKPFNDGPQSHLEPRTLPQKIQEHPRISILRMCGRFRNDFEIISDWLWRMFESISDWVRNAFWRSATRAREDGLSIWNEFRLEPDGVEMNPPFHVISHDIQRSLLQRGRSHSRRNECPPQYGRASSTMSWLSNFEQGWHWQEQSIESMLRYDTSAGASDIEMVHRNMSGIHIGSASCDSVELKFHAWCKLPFLVLIVCFEKRMRSTRTHTRAHTHTHTKSIY